MLQLHAFVFDFSLCAGYCGSETGRLTMLC